MEGFGVPSRIRWVMRCLIALLLASCSSSTTGASSTDAGAVLGESGDAMAVSADGATGGRGLDADGGVVDEVRAEPDAGRLDAAAACVPMVDDWVDPSDAGRGIIRRLDVSCDANKPRVLQCSGVDCEPACSAWLPLSAEPHELAFCCCPE